MGWEPGSAAEDSATIGRWRMAWPWTWLDVGWVPEATRRADVDGWLLTVNALCPPPDRCREMPEVGHHVATATALIAAMRLQPAADQARALLEVAVALAPDDPKVLNNFATLEMQSDHAAAALQLCEQALAAAPDYARAHRTAARAALMLHRDEEAVVHARAYVAAQPRRETQPWLRELAGSSPPGVAARLLELLQR